MRNSENINRFKRDVSKSYKPYDNDTLVIMLNDGKTDEVVKALLPLVIYVVNKFPPNDFEDLISVGNVGLLKALETFDINKGGKLISHCRSKIRFTILDYYNYEKSFVRLPLCKNVSEKVLESRPIIVKLDDMAHFEVEDEIYYETKITRQEVRDLLMSVQGIKAYKVEIFLDYFFIEGASQRFVGELNGVTGQNISLIISNIIKIIKRNKKLLARMSELLK